MILPILLIAAFGVVYLRGRVSDAGSTQSSFGSTQSSLLPSAASSPQPQACGHERDTGTYVGVAPGPDWEKRVGRFDAAGIKPWIIEFYMRFGSKYDYVRACQVTKLGAIPYTQINPVGVSLKSIARGRYDTWIKSLALTIKAFKQRVALSFAPEMNGTWYKWGKPWSTPKAYTDAWHHIVQVFIKNNVKNVSWVWTIDACCSARKWWPGADYVNWVGVDGYLRPGVNFNHRFMAAISEVRGFTTKPILISEMAANPGPNRIERIQSVFAGVRRARLLGAVWFDMNARARWRIDDDPAVLSVLSSAGKK